MEITIQYESSWGNSFLDGSNDEQLPDKGRNYIASLTELRKEGNFIRRQITHNTVMGILNRLIGDQRKLYQSREDEQYYFKDIEGSVTFSNDPKKLVLNDEVIYLRNVKGSDDRESFTGMIRSNAPIFTSNYSDEFWGVLGLQFEALLDFILDSTSVKTKVSLNPISIAALLTQLSALKAVENEGRVEDVVKALGQRFPDAGSYIGANGMIRPGMLYCAALYINLERLGSKYDMTSAKTKAGGIGGISKRGFTKKDFMNLYTTGKKKKIWGNPYMKVERIKGLGEVSSFLTKSSGELRISLNLRDEQALGLKKLIDCAGVSSFYMGKKGLAYVTEIRI